MPNGRSGGFIIKKTDLERMVKEMPEAIGATVAFGNSPRPRPIDASEMVQLLEKCPNDRLAIEEQDHSWYIIHISNEPEIVWVTVSPNSLLVTGGPDPTLGAGMKLLNEAAETWVNRA